MATREKMSRQDRAKQFVPFAALKGYEDALRAKEKVVVPKIELTEERKEELDRQIRKIRPGDMAEVVYFSQGEYLRVTGMVSRLDVDARVLRVVNTGIAFADILEIRTDGGPFSD